MTERARCPACGSTAFLRAVEVREFRIRSGVWAWLLGLMKITTVGANAICANPGCGGAGEPLRIDRDGVRRLRVNAPVQHAPEPPPAEKEHRDPIVVNRTPGMAWSREPR